MDLGLAEYARIRARDLGGSAVGLALSGIGSQGYRNEVEARIVNLSRKEV